MDWMYCSFSRKSTPIVFLYLVQREPPQQIFAGTVSAAGFDVAHSGWRTGLGVGFGSRCWADICVAILGQACQEGFHGRTCP